MAQQQQLNNHIFAYAKQFSDNAFRAHTVALKGFEQVAALQLSALESQARHTADFLSVAVDTRDADGFRGLWEKGVALNRDNAERAVAVSQEIFAVAQKTVESLGALAQEQQQAANDAVAPVAAAVKKAAK